MQRGVPKRRAMKACTDADAALIQLRTQGVGRDAVVGKQHAVPLAKCAQGGKRHDRGHNVGHMRTHQHARVGLDLGGGMGRLREVCGAVSGMFMVYDLVCGYAEPGDMEAKKRTYADIRELAARFSVQSGGSIICRDLLAGVETSAGGDPEQRTPEYYQKRPCPNLVALAADVLDEFLKEKHIL